MSSRLVRCPKCRQILLESPNVFVYKCGGCGTFLQAKVQNINVNSTTTGLQETVTAQKNKGDQVSGDKESCSSHGAILSSGESSQDQNIRKDQNVSGDCNSKKQLTGVNLIDDQNNKIDQNESGHIACGLLVAINLLNEDQENGSHQIESGNCGNEPVGGVNFPNRDQNNGNKLSNCNNDQNGISDEVGNQNEPADCYQEQAEVMNMPSEHQNNESDQSEFEDREQEQAEAVNLPNEGQNNGIDRNGYAYCNIEHAEICKNQNECQDWNEQFGDVNNDEQLAGVNSSNKDPNNRSDQNESSEGNIEQPQILNEVCSTTECSMLQNEDVSPLAGENSVEDHDKNSSLAMAKELGDGESDSNLRTFCDELINKKDGNSTIIAPGPAGKSNPPDSITFSPDEHLDQNQESAVNAHGPAGLSISSDSIRSSPDGHLEQHKDNADSPSGGSISSHTLRCVPNEQLEQPQISDGTALRLTKESILLDSFISSPNEYQERLKEYHLFNRGRFTATCEPTEFIDPSSELSGILIDLSKSPTTKSSRAYYDDGVSSYEETDDQLPSRHKHSLKNAYKPPNCVPSDEKRRKTRFLVNNNSEMQHQLRSCTAIMSDEAMKSSKLEKDEFLDHQVRYAVKSSTLDPEELLEPTSAQNWRQLGRDEYSSQLPFYERALLADYENGMPSDHLRNEFLWNSSSQSLAKAAGTEHEKIKLLRMIYELQDQVNILKKTNGRIPHGITTKEHIPMYYGHETVDEEIFHKFNYPWSSGQFRERSKWPHRSQNSRIPFSAEATSSRRQFDHYLCCCSQDWKVSAQIPQHGLRPPKCRRHSHPSISNSHRSCPARPLQHVESDFPSHFHGTKPGDQGQRGHDIKKYLWEKHHLARRHLLPIASGAPFITCPSCFKVLKLPEDFFLSKRRCHWLRCGACAEVLKFSVLNRTHLVPYTPTANAPPPTEADEYSDALNRRNLAQSHSRHCPHGDPMSCSEDYGLPFCNSCSTDCDPIYQRSFHAIEGNAVDSDVSQECDRERRTVILNEAQKRCKYPVEMYESSHKPSSSMSNSKEVCSEIDELPRRQGGGRGGSPLHQLMGYASPSQVINGAEYGLN